MHSNKPVSFAVLPFIRAWVVAGLPCMFAVAGCSPRSSTFQIVDHREGHSPRYYQESFDEGYYDLDSHGNMDIVLRRREPSQRDSKVELAQVIHIRSFWKPIPGTTVAERSQINSSVSYCIRNGKVGATFEGAGSVFFKQNRQENRLVGTLEHVTLRPKRRLAGGGAVFEQVNLSGSFRALRDSRRVARILNELDRLFGPLPRYQPQASALRRSAGSLRTAKRPLRDAKSWERPRILLRPSALDRNSSR